MAVAAELVGGANPGGKKKRYFWIAGCFSEEGKKKRERALERNRKVKRGMFFGELGERVLLRDKGIL